MRRHGVPVGGGKAKPAVAAALPAPADGVMEVAAEAAEVSRKKGSKARPRRADGRPETGRARQTDRAARKLFAGACDFVAGAASLDSLPAIALPEIAFAGRSMSASRPGQCDRPPHAWPACRQPRPRGRSISSTSPAIFSGRPAGLRLRPGFAVDEGTWQDWRRPICWPPDTSVSACWWSRHGEGLRPRDHEEPRQRRRLHQLVLTKTDKPGAADVARAVAAAEAVAPSTALRIPVLRPAARRGSALASYGRRMPVASG
jgi:GTP-binding protein